MWIHQHPDWPKFRYEDSDLPIDEIGRLESYLENLLTNLDINIIQTIQLETLCHEILGNSLIEGIILPEDSVRSSLFRRLAIKNDLPERFDRRAQNCMEIMVDAISNPAPMTTERLLSWQTKAVSGTGWDNIPVGRFRNEDDGLMKIVSGPIGFEKTHYQAVNGKDVEKEISLFLDWLNCESDIPAICKSALAHLRLVLIHPFGDGNGRVSRALADYVLAKSNPKLVVFSGMSVALMQNRKQYMDCLDNICCMDVTEWVTFICKMRLQSLEKAISNIKHIIGQHDLIKQANNLGCSKQQLTVLHKISRHDFQGKLTVEKYAKIAKCNKYTAKKEIEDMERKKIIIKNGGGYLAAFSNKIDSEESSVNNEEDFDVSP